MAAGVIFSCEPESGFPRWICREKVGWGPEQAQHPQPKGWPWMVLDRESTESTGEQSRNMGWGTGDRWTEGWQGRRAPSQNPSDKCSWSTSYATYTAVSAPETVSAKAFCKCVSLFKQTGSISDLLKHRQGGGWPRLIFGSEVERLYLVMGWEWVEGRELVGSCKPQDVTGVKRET